ncbi:MAG: HAD family hydrolase [Methanobrevibacter sp.]|jgi:Cu+-exporting ATPase|nr:HAD family hydrolase [Candidatus Methanoflexus mossambicus]
MKKAVVFDVAGTLLERYRAVKNVNTGKITDKGTTLEIIDDLPNTALVVLQSDTRACIMKENANTRFYDFLIKRNINIDISYSSSDISKEDIIKRLKNDKTLIKEFQEVAYILAKNYEFIEICSGSAFVFDANKNKITHIIAAGGKLFPNVKKVIKTLNHKQIDTYIASGDREDSLYEIGNIIKVPLSNVFPTMNMKGKGEIIKELKKKYKVMMVGNGPNDVLAFKNADVSVLTLEQKEPVSQSLMQSAEYIINDIIEVLDIKF